MNPEIEKLINLAVVDGQISDKGRSVILKKAEKLGINLNEVGIAIDEKLYKALSTTNIKVDNKNVCPSCGAPVKEFQFKCEFCGHEFRNTKTEGYIAEFRMALEKGKTEIDEKFRNKIFYQFLMPDFSPKHKLMMEIIESYQLPNNKVDNIELIIFAYTHYENAKKNILSSSLKIVDAWYKKTKKGIELLKNYNEIDFQSQKIINKYRNNLSKTNHLLYMFLRYVLFVLFFLAYIIIMIAAPTLFYLIIVQQFF